MNDPLPSNAEQIVARMAEVRGEVDHGVEQFVRSVRQRTDWRYYLRRFPVLLPAALVAVGYVALPWRKQMREFAKLAAPSTSTSVASNRVVSSSAVVDLATTILGIVGTYAVRGTVAYVGRRLQEKMENRRS